MVTRYGHGVPRARIEIVEAAHPVPDAAGQAAAARILELAHSAGPDDLVLCLISGGGSSLLTLPADGLTLADKQAVNRALLASGADIAQMNRVRRHRCGPKVAHIPLLPNSYTTADIIPLRITTSVEYTGYRRDHRDTGDIRA